MNEQALRLAISEQPFDDLPKLVFADWLDEQSRSIEALFVRHYVLFGEINYGFIAHHSDAEADDDCYEWSDGEGEDQCDESCGEGCGSYVDDLYQAGLNYLASVFTYTSYGRANENLS
jgi:uncharacterized protein (TIGR02996 family)